MNLKKLEDFLYSDKVVLTNMLGFTTIRKDGIFAEVSNRVKRTLQLDTNNPLLYTLRKRLFTNQYGDWEKEYWINNTWKYLHCDLHHEKTRINVEVNQNLPMCRLRVPNDSYYMVNHGGSSHPLFKAIEKGALHNGTYVVVPLHFFKKHIMPAVWT